MKADNRPPSGWCQARLLLLPLFVLAALLMSCNSGPGCSCNCERKKNGVVVGGCAVSNHCQVHSNGCHVGCT